MIVIKKEAYHLFSQTVVPLYCFIVPTSSFILRRYQNSSATLKPLPNTFQDSTPSASSVLQHSSSSSQALKPYSGLQSATIVGSTNSLQRCANNDYAVNKSRTPLPALPLETGADGYGVGGGASGPSAAVDIPASGKDSLRGLQNSHNANNITPNNNNNNINNNNPNTNLSNDCNHSYAKSKRPKPRPSDLGSTAYDPSHAHTPQVSHTHSSSSSSSAAQINHALVESPPHYPADSSYESPVTSKPATNHAAGKYNAKASHSSPASKYAVGHAPSYSTPAVSNNLAASPSSNTRGYSRFTDQTDSPHSSRGQQSPASQFKGQTASATSPLQPSSPQYHNVNMNGERVSNSSMV